MLTPDEWQVLRLTLLAASLSVAFILPPGLALAWLLARKTWPGKSLVETAVTLPLVLPPVATGLLLLKLAGRHGIVGGWLYGHVDWDVVFTWRAVVLAQAVMSFPLLVKGARTAFEEVDREQEEVAGTLGARAWQVWWRVTLPLARRGLLAGTLLAFTRSLGEFGATIVVAGNIPGETQTVALALYQQIQLGENDAALRLLSGAVLLAFAAVWASERLATRRRSRI